MITLVVDTALAAVQAAVLDGGSVRASACDPMARGHQERLAPLVSEVLAAAGLAPADLDRVAVTVGPGSFTGLRVGLAFAKVFALARAIPCVGVGALEALAAAFPQGPVAAAIAAPHGRVYLQRFIDAAALEPPGLLPLEAAQAVCAGFRAIGPGALLLNGAEADAIGWPDIEALARRGALATAAPEPIYLREVGALTLAERRAAAVSAAGG